MDFLKTVGGKLASGMVALAVIVAAIAWFSMDAPTRSAVLGGAGKIIAWAGLVAVWPWVTFALIGRVARMGRNAAGAALVISYTLGEVVLLLWLFNWRVPGATAWTFLAVGTLLAGAYNLLVCDWIAEKIE